MGPQGEQTMRRIFLFALTLALALPLTVPARAAEQLRTLLWLTELGTVVWSARHGDTEYEAIGRATLARLEAGWSPLEAS